MMFNAYFYNLQALPISLFMKKIYCFLILSFFFTTQLSAQIKSPEEFLGYAPGERFTPYYRVLDYFEHVASNTPNISMIQYGETYEYRPLIATFITSPENFKNLEAIRRNNLSRTGLIDSTAAGYDDIAIVWLSYNVHGNEAVSTEAAIQVLYDLANPDNQQAQEWLKNTVVVIDPCLNPDGRERYVQWYQQKAASSYNPNPDAWEHHEPWPEGRTNHYLFDLNRDWAWATQKETRERLALYNQWLPQIHADYHEQNIDNPYYFAPAVEPYHQLITDWQRQFQVMLGENNASYFDKEGWQYFTDEVFDLLYPSYGDTYPIFNGAIGMTYEQGGGGRAGLGIMNAAHDTLTLVDRIAHHVTTSLSTIELSAKNARKLVQEYTSFYEQSNNNPDGTYKAFVIKQGDNSGKITALKSLLDKHHIRYSQSTGSQNFSGFSYQNQKSGKFHMQQGDLIISAYQPKSVLLQVLFEPEAQLSDSLTYDITAWAIPYAYDLDAYALTSHVSGGETATEHAFTAATVKENTYAYVAPWQSMENAHFLAQLLKKDIKVRYAMYDFEVEGKQFKAGSLIISREDNEDKEAFDQEVVNVANNVKQVITPIATGLMTKGYDLGSGNIRFIEPPKVAMLAGEGTSPYGVGEVWYYFEQQLAYPLTIINIKDADHINLSDYNTLILADGSYQQTLEDMNIDEWISQGGKVIALEGALSYFEESDNYALTEYTEEQQKVMDAKEKAKKKEDQLMSYASQERRNISNATSGSIFKLRLDNTHPLALGYPDHYYTLKSGSARYAYLKDGWNVGTIQSSDDLVSGFVGSEMLSRLPESLVLGIEEIGSGQVIYMVDDPLFRAFWNNGKLLFANALFLVGQR